MSHRFDLSGLSHEAVDEGFASRVTQDRAITAELIAYLGEVGARGRHLTFGYSSLYDYCTKRFGMSEDVAKKRIRLARLARRHPVLLDHVADGRVGLTALLMMSAVLFHAKQDEGEALLAEACGKTNDEIALLLVARAPKLDTPTAFEELAPSPLTHAPAAAPTLFSEEIGAARPVVPSLSREAGGSMEPESHASPAACPTAPSAPPTPRSQLAPLTPTRFEFRTTFDEQTIRELREAAEIMSHVIPNGDLGLVLARLVRVGLRQARKQRYAETHRPRAPRMEEPTAGIPERVVREVYARDRGCCTFRGEDGRVCGSRWRVELDHIVPRAHGGASTTDNLRLLCRAHNQHEAERVFGADFMRGKRAWGMRRKQEGKRSA